MILPRFILQTVGLRVLGALVVLVSILQILDLLDVTTEILDRRLGPGGVLYYVALRTPALIQQVAPLSVLAGCLFAFGQLARENAVVVLRSSGLSAYRITAFAAPAALAAALLHLGVNGWLAPASQAALDAWWARSAPGAEETASASRSFRVGRDIVVASPGDEAGRRLADITIYRRDAEGRLMQRTRADAATYEGGGWRLRGARFEMLGTASVRRGSADEMSWPDGPRPDDVRLIFADSQMLAPGTAQRALAGGPAARSEAFYRTHLHRAWAAPVGALVMLLLAAPVCLVNFRNSGGRVMVACLTAGLLFLVTDGLFTALGEGGSIPAALAAWAGPAMFASASVAALLFLEG